MPVTYATRAGDLRALIEALDDAGNVLTDPKYVGDWGKFIQQFVVEDEGQKWIRGWWIYRSSAVNNAGIMREVWKLKRFLAVHGDSGSGHQFQEHLDAALRFFRDNQGPVEWAAIPNGLQLRGTDERVFGNTLCHFGECELEILMDADVL